MEEMHLVYQDLFELAPTPHAIFDLDGNCLLANRSFRIQLAFEPGIPDERTVQFHELFEKPDSATTFLNLLQEKQVVRRHETLMRDVEGQVFTALVSGRTLDYAGQRAHEISFTNISRDKNLQSALRREHARLSSLVENLTAGLFLVNEQGLITEINMWLADILAIDQKHLIGQPYQELFSRLIALAAEPEFVKHSLDKGLANVSARPKFSFTLTREKLRYMELSYFPMWHEDGFKLGWGGLVQDLTDLRDQTTWKLELLSILAHDLRTPLATLKGHATALLANYRHWGPDLVTEFLEVINHSVDELVHQVDQSLALTRVESGRLGLYPESVKPGRIVEQALERAAGILAKVRIEIDLPADLPEVRVDPARVEEVLTNLLENATRYNPKGKPLIVRARAEENLVEVSVIDHGQGVPPEKRAKIFDKYVRGDSEQAGTGLGLFISRKIVEAHGGRIWVESPPAGTDRGAQFSFTLPVMPAISPVSPPETAAAIRPDDPDDPFRILIVEDEADMQALLRRILIENGYRVDIAGEGQTALDIIQAAQPDLVLLDWILPGMSGLSICRNIRRWSDVPIMMVTSKTSQEELVAALDAGADDYVIKPFDSGEILARIRSLLRRGDSLPIHKGPDRFHAEGLTVDFETRQVWMRGSPLRLTPREYDLLAYMVRHPRQVLTYGQIIAEVWGDPGQVTRHGLFVHVSRLRKKIETDPAKPRFITNQWGVGYVFLPDQ